MTRDYVAQAHFLRDFFLKPLSALEEDVLTDESPSDCWSWSFTDREGEDWKVIRDSSRQPCLKAKDKEEP